MSSDEIVKVIANKVTKAIKRTEQLDGTLRESERADMRIKIRRLLKEHGYLLDLQKLAVEIVVKQENLIVGDI